MISHSSAETLERCLMLLYRLYLYSEFEAEQRRHWYFFKRAIAKLFLRPRRKKFWNSVAILYE